jgi:hypothetical protein
MVEDDMLFNAGDFIDVYFKNSDSEAGLDLISINKVSMGYRVVLGSGDKQYTYIVDNEGKGDKIEIQSQGVFEITPEMAEKKQKLNKDAFLLWQVYNAKSDKQTPVQGRVPSVAINPTPENITISRAKQDTETGEAIRTEPEAETGYRIVTPGHNTELYLIESSGAVEDLKTGRKIDARKFLKDLSKNVSNLEKGSDREKIVEGLGFDVTKLYAPEENLSEVSEFIETPGESSTMPTTEVAVQGTPGFIIDMRGPKQLVDYTTANLITVAKVYKQTQFIQKNEKGQEVGYNLSEDRAKEIMDENPNNVFVFDWVRPNADGIENPSARNGTRQAWRKGLLTGQSFGLTTRTFKGTTPTDEQFERVKEIIDEQVQQLVQMRDAGKIITFPSDGIGQNFKQAGADQIFVYLSKKLLENFGYKNPVFDNMSLVLGPLEVTGMDYIQDFYKELTDVETGEPAQTVTDSEVMEHIKTCKLK